MTPEQILQARLAKWDSQQWDGVALRIPCRGGLHLGAHLTDEGWTVEELGAVPGWRDLMRTDYDRLIAETRAHWFAEWAKQDAEAAARLVERERQRVEAIERQRVEELKRLAAARSSAWVASGVPEGLRLDVAFFEDRAYFSTGSRAAALQQVLGHPSYGSDGKLMHLNLALLGPTGTGKSLLSAIWLHEQISADLTGRFIDARTLSRRILNAREPERVVSEMASFDVLVIDDVLAADEDCEPERVGALVEVLSARSMGRAFTCFSSNRSGDELLEVFGARGFSRLMHGALVLPIDGPDWRLPMPGQPAAKVRRT
jgi:DNA replication protein DnaC